MITIYDTAAGSQNLGDSIIMDTVSRELADIFPQTFMRRFATHYPMSLDATKQAKQGSLSFFGGTNALHRKWRLKARKNQWSIGPVQFLTMNPTILMGTGWRSYSRETNWLGRKIYQRILSSQHMHSVRDDYTRQQLEKIGIHNVINTACPTMWRLTPEHLDQIPQQKAPSAVFTITDYAPSINEDRQMVEQIKSSYERVYFWPQGHLDITYVKEQFDTRGVEILSPNLASFDEILSGDIDYIGTRLHAGVRALQHKKRSIIVAIDNRAREIAKDTGLIIVERGDEQHLRQLIEANHQQTLKIPLEAIAAWKAQFAAA
jgi:polysaccharide pyruvyl transferase WcaK-like protein